MDTQAGRRKKLPKYLFFTIRGNIFTSRLADIKEVVNDLELGKVPLQNAFTVGMSSLRGEIISLLSLNQLLSASVNARNSQVSTNSSLENDEYYRKMVTLVVEHKNLKYGLLIDTIKQVGVLNPDHFKESGEFPWISGHYHLEDTIATVVNLKQLLEHQCPNANLSTTAA